MEPEEKDGTDSADGTADTTNNDSSSEESSDKTSDDTELTPEQRDEQTIARLTGTEPAQDEPSDDDGDGDGDADADGDASDSDADSTSDSDDADSTADSDSADGDEDSTDDGDAAGDGESNADDDIELTDEDIETFLDAADDRVVKSPRMQKIIEQMAKAAADKISATRLEQTEVSQETQRLIEKGGQAAKKIEALFGRAGKTLAEYVAGNEVDEEVVLDPEELTGHLRDFAVASAVRTRQSYDNAFASAFREVAPLSGEAFTDDEAKDVIKIVQTADRIRQDPEQGEIAANAYLYKESFKYLVERAKASGATAEKTDAKKRREATKRVIGDKNSTKAAMSKIASKRKKVAPKSVKTEPEGVASEFSMESYRAAKLAGNHEEADRITLGMAAAGQGQAVSGR